MLSLSPIDDPDQMMRQHPECQDEVGITLQGREVTLAANLDHKERFESVTSSLLSSRFSDEVGLPSLKEGCILIPKVTLVTNINCEQGLRDSSWLPHPEITSLLSSRFSYEVGFRSF